MHPTTIFYTCNATYELAGGIIRGISTLYILQCGQTVASAFTINALYSLGTFLFEVPTGVLADRAGRRRSYLISSVTQALGTAAYIGAYPLRETPDAAFAVLAVGTLAMGLGYAFASGSIEAWLVDTLASRKSEVLLDNVLARNMSITMAAMCVGVVGGGAVATVTALWVPYAMRAGLLAVNFAFAYRYVHEDEPTVEEAEAAADAKSQAPSALSRAAVADVGRAILDKGWRIPGVRASAVSGALSSFSFLFIVYAWQPAALILLGQDAESGAWVAALVTLVVMLGSMFGSLAVPRLVRAFDRRSSLVAVSMTLGSLGMLGAGLTYEYIASPSLTAFWSTFACIFGAFVALGPSQSVRRTLLHSFTASSHRATIVSADTLLSSVTAFVGQIALGAVADTAGYGMSFIAATAGLLAAALHAPLFLRANVQDHDRFAIPLAPPVAPEPPTVVPSSTDGRVRRRSTHRRHRRHRRRQSVQSR
jgi:MFS family permease